MSLSESPPASCLSFRQRMVILTCGFLGWLFAGVHMAITTIAMQPAAIDLLSRSGQLDAARYQQLNTMFQGRPASLPAAASRLAETDRLGTAEAAAAVDTAATRQWQLWKGRVARWFAWLQCAFLFGAAAGGLGFGWLGDRCGRARAMAASILTYSLMSAAASVAQTPWQLLACWFVACTGVGGMWPNGVALISEAWSGWSRAMTAGVIGTSANMGIFLASTIAGYKGVTPDSWRWVLQAGAVPCLLGCVSAVVVPESPRWLASRRQRRSVAAEDASDEGGRLSSEGSLWDVFRPPLLGTTVIAIVLATVPLIGSWGSANWMIPWADDVGSAMQPPNPLLKAQVQQARSLTGIVGSFLGGWSCSLLGRRRAYALISCACLISAQYSFWLVKPGQPAFLPCVAALGFFSGVYFGWLPLFLPELFPTRVRSTGAGVGFNFGRVLTAVTVFATGALISLFGGDYARIGQVTSLVFAVGIVAALLAPDTSRQPMPD